MKSLSLGWILAFFALAGAVGGAFATASQTEFNPFILPIFIAVAVLPITIIWWRKTDEGVREAHKWAWFWGGSLGMLAALMLIMLDANFGRGGVASLGVVFGTSDVETGALVTVTATGIGYMLAWGLWWLRHR